MATMNSGSYKDCTTAELYFEDELFTIKICGAIRGLHDKISLIFIYFHLYSCDRTFGFHCMYCLSVCLARKSSYNGDIKIFSLGIVYRHTQDLVPKSLL